MWNIGLVLVQRIGVDVRDASVAAAVAVAAVVLVRDTLTGVLRCPQPYNDLVLGRWLVDPEMVCFR